MRNALRISIKLINSINVIVITYLGAGIPLMASLLEAIGRLAADSDTTNRVISLN